MRRRRHGRWREVDGRLIRLFLAVTISVALLTVGLAFLLAPSREGDILVGAVKDPATSRPSTSLTPAITGGGASTTVLSPDLGPVGTGLVGPGLLDANGQPYGAPIPFNAAIEVPAGLIWVLLIGSDARPGQAQAQARADSIHLVAANPATGKATIIGFPRDSYVEIPGRGRDKINSALSLGGPELLAKTINRFTGLPVQYWVLAGFEAFQRVVDEVGGLDMQVPTKMNDRFSGARFNPGYHHFDGAQALAFSRDRHDFGEGDFARSKNHGLVMLAALIKLRAEVGDEVGLRTWVGVAFRHLALDLDLVEALQLLAVARRIDPSNVTNLVLAGRSGSAGRAGSVVYLDAAAAAAVADDVRADAAIGSDPSLPTVPTLVPPSTTSSTFGLPLLPTSTTPTRFTTSTTRFPSSTTTSSVTTPSSLTTSTTRSTTSSTSTSSPSTSSTSTTRPTATTVTTAPAG